MSEAGRRQTQAETLGGTLKNWTYGYDNLDRLISANEGTNTENYSYDYLNNRKSKTAAGSTLAYVYDSANQLTQIRQGSDSGTILASLGYDNNGDLTSRTGSNPLTLTWDAEGKLQAANGETYLYDDQGRRIKKTVGVTTTNYLYNGPDIHAETSAAYATQAVYAHGPNWDDPLIRLTGATNQPAANASYYHQDGLNSVVAMTDNNGPRSNAALAANGGVISASSTYSASYPASGANNGDRSGLNWGTGGGWNDATNNSWPDWLQIDFAAAKTINEINVYTLQDNAATTEPTLATTFTQDGITAFDVQYWNGSAWVTLASVTGNNKVWRQFSFSPVTTSKIRIVVNGGANTTYAYSRIVEVEAYTVDSSATQRFDAWGNKIQASGSIPQYGYTGREPDATGLMYYRARYYDPSIARFISRDPIGARGGLNRYSYVGNNPTNFTDPSGLKAADPATTWVNNAYKGYVDLSGQGFTSAKQNLGTVTMQMLDDNGQPLVDQIPGMPPSSPSIPQTSFEKLKDTAGNVAGKLMDGLQALSPAEGVLVGAIGMIKGVANTAKIADLGYDANKISHVFNEKHMLDPLVNKFGSREGALAAMHNAAQSLAKTAYQTGTWVTIKVGEIPVAVSGAVVNGEFRIGTATMRPFK